MVREKGSSKLVLMVWCKYTPLNHIRLYKAYIAISCYMCINYTELLMMFGIYIQMLLLLFLPLNIRFLFVYYNFVLRVSVFVLPHPTLVLLYFPLISMLLILYKTWEFGVTRYRFCWCSGLGMADEKRRLWGFEESESFHNCHDWEKRTDDCKDTSRILK